MHPALFLGMRGCVVLKTGLIFSFLLFLSSEVRADYDSCGPGSNHNEQLTIDNQDMMMPFEEEVFGVCPGGGGGGSAYHVLESEETEFTQNAMLLQAEPLIEEKGVYTRWSYSAPEDSESKLVGILFYPNRKIQSLGEAVEYFDESILVSDESLEQGIHSDQEGVLIAEVRLPGEMTFNHLKIDGSLLFVHGEFEDLAILTENRGSETVSDEGGPLDDGDNDVTSDDSPNSDPQGGVIFDPGSLSGDPLDAQPGERLVSGAVDAGEISRVFSLGVIVGNGIGVESAESAVDIYTNRVGSNGSISSSDGNLSSAGPLGNSSAGGCSMAALKASPVSGVLMVFALIAAFGLAYQRRLA